MFFNTTDQKLSQTGETSIGAKDISAIVGVEHPESLEAVDGNTGHAGDLKNPASEEATNGNAEAMQTGILSSSSTSEKIIKDSQTAIRSASSKHEETIKGKPQVTHSSGAEEPIDKTETTTNAKTIIGYFLLCSIIVAALTYGLSFMPHFWGDQVDFVNCPINIQSSSHVIKEAVDSKKWVNILFFHLFFNVPFIN